MAEATPHLTGQHGFLYGSQSRLTALLLLLVMPYGLTSASQPDQFNNASSTFPLGLHTGAQCTVRAPFGSAPSTPMSYPGFSQYLHRCAAHPPADADGTAQFFSESHVSIISPSMITAALDEFDDADHLYSFATGSGCSAPFHSAWGRSPPHDVPSVAVPKCHPWSLVCALSLLMCRSCGVCTCPGSWVTHPLAAVPLTVRMESHLEYLFDTLYSTAMPVSETTAQINMIVCPFLMLARFWRRRRRRYSRRRCTRLPNMPLFNQPSTWGQVRSFGARLHTFQLVSSAGLSFFVAGRSTAPRFIMQHSRGSTAGRMPTACDLAMFLQYYLTP
jgi:hypothetical protein